MSTGFVQVAADSTGKKLQTFENTISGEDVHAEGVVVVDAAGVPIVRFSTTATTTQVADTATSTMLLSANAGRFGATIQNDSSAVLYVKLGTTASATNYTVRLVQYAYFEVPFGYTGRIDGIWATDPDDGAARITELT